MTTLVHPDVISDGLNQLIGVSLNYVICQTEPFTHTDASTLSGGGGKRISNVETLTPGLITLSDGANSISKKITVPVFEMNSTIQVPVSGGAVDLWLAIYDGTRLLLKTDQITNRDLVADATVVCASYDFGVNQ